LNPFKGVTLASGNLRRRRRPRGPGVDGTIVIDVE
jgi:hypothetical protein